MPTATRPPPIAPKRRTMNKTANGSSHGDNPTKEKGQITSNYPSANDTTTSHRRQHISEKIEVRKGDSSVHSRRVPVEPPSKGPMARTPHLSSSRTSDSTEPLPFTRSASRTIRTIPIRGEKPSAHPHTVPPERPAVPSRLSNYSKTQASASHTKSPNNLPSISKHNRMPPELPKMPPPNIPARMSHAEEKGPSPPSNATNPKGPELPKKKAASRELPFVKPSLSTLPKMEGGLPVLPPRKIDSIRSTTNRVDKSESVKPLAHTSIKESMEPTQKNAQPPPPRDVPASPPAIPLRSNLPKNLLQTIKQASSPAPENAPLVSTSLSRRFNFNSNLPPPEKFTNKKKVYRSRKDTPNPHGTLPNDPTSSQSSRILASSPNEVPPPPPLPPT